MDEWERVRLKIRDLQSRFLGGQEPGGYTSPPETLAPNPVWKESHPDERRQMEEKLLDRQTLHELTRKIQEMEQRLLHPRQAPPPPAPDFSTRDAFEKEKIELKARIEALQEENISLKGNVNKVFQLHKSETEASAELSKRLEAEKRQRLEDENTLRHAMMQLRQEHEKKVQEIEREKTELSKLLNEMKSNNNSLSGQFQSLQKENSFLKDNLLNQAEVLYMREKLHFNQIEKLSQGLGRRLKNYLAMIAGSIEISLQSPAGSDALMKEASSLQENLGFAERTVNEFLELAKYPEMNFEEIPMNELLDSVARGLEDLANQAGVQWTREYEETPLIYADRNLLKEAFRQIFLNSLEACQPGASIVVQLGYNSTTQKIEVTVGDTGCGIPESAQNKIFQPYFTTKKGHRGMGLCNAKKFINVHHGWITLTSVENQGTTLAIEIPISRPV